MKPIELERWMPSASDPCALEYAGQRTAREVFEELKHRLEDLGYLPDEYFLLDSRWKDGQEIPKGADIFCATDYGASEGIYVDVYLNWREDGRPITEDFITGKTLGENGKDLDRMFLIASAITKAFHGDRTTYERYTPLGKQSQLEGGIYYMSGEERRAVIDALAMRREQLIGDTVQTEQLLRRMTGGGTPSTGWGLTMSCMSSRPPSICCPTSPSTRRAGRTTATWPAAAPRSSRC